MKTLKIILIVLLALLVLAAGGGAYGAYRVSQLDTNYPNLSVNGIPVGGLTREQTVEALNAAGWETRLSTPLTVTTLGGQSFTVDPLKSGVLQTTEGIAEMAFRYGREGNIIEDLISYLKCRFRATELEHPEQNAELCRPGSPARRGGVCPGLRGRKAGAAERLGPAEAG